MITRSWSFNSTGKRVIVLNDLGNCSLSYPGWIRKYLWTQGEGMCFSSWLLIIIERVMLLMRFHAFCKIMGLIESGLAALSGSKELTASSSRLG